MSVGYTSLKGDFDSRAGQLATSLAVNLYQCNQFYLLLTSSAWGQTNLVNLGYTSGEATTLINAFTDLGGTGNSLYKIAHAGGTVASANDFFFNAKQLMGTQYTGM